MSLRKETKLEKTLTNLENQAYMEVQGDNTCKSLKTLRNTEKP
jgi:hypothetical protein